MIYIILAITAAVLVAAAVVGCWKPGKNDDLCKYEEDEKNDL